MNLRCLLTGHRWDVGPASTDVETVFRCARCGKTRIGKAGDRVTHMSRSGSYTDASAMSISRDLHANDPHR